MKRSLKRQLAAVFIALSVFSALIVILTNYFFLPDYYVTRKAEILQKTQALFEQYLAQDKPEKGAEEIFREFCLTNNLTVAVTNPDFSVRYTNSNEGVKMAGNLIMYLLGQQLSESDVIKHNENCVIQKNRDISSNIEFLEMYGHLEDESGYFLVRTPLEGIRIAAQISNRFYLYTAITSAVIGTLLILLLTGKLTRPVTELTKLSLRMAELDFNARYEGGGTNEIAVLGHNFNKMSETLEHTISELKTANNQLLQDIAKKNEIDQMRREFLSNVSHELKTPIALIQGYAEGLQDNINEDAQSRAFYCEVIMDEASKMNRMVKKLLTLNQLEFGNEQISMERFDITELISGILQSSEILIEQKEAKIIFEQTEPIYVWSDEFMVEEVITNYLTNALNHLDKEKKIELRCEPMEDKRICVSVFNTGEPIPEEELENIWIKFYKVDKARTREYGGSGIGLSIVKAIMEALHQECGVTNFENGVEFWFTL